MTDTPDVQAALAQARELWAAVADMRRRVDEIRTRRPSPTGRVIPEVDALGRLTDLYLEPGTTRALDRHRLTADIMAAIHDSVADARTQYRAIVADTPLPPPPLNLTLD